MNAERDLQSEQRLELLATSFASRLAGDDKQSVVRELARRESGDSLRKPTDVVERSDSHSAFRLLSAVVAKLSPSDADVLLSSLVSFDPKCRQAYLVRARCLLDANKPLEAVTSIKSALAVYYDDLLAHRMLFEAYKNMPLKDRPNEAGAADFDLQGRYCNKPFNHFETTVNGDVYVCCPSYLPVSIGNIHSQTWEEIWNSPVARELRRSIHDGDFHYCSRLSCPVIQAKGLPRVDAVLQDNAAKADSGNVVAAREIRTIESKATELDYGPGFVNLSHDRSCNLSCPSCRTKTIIAKSAEQQTLDDILDKTVLPVLSQAHRVWITGSGDPFGSKHFREVLTRLNPAQFPNLTVDLQTNAVLFSESEWRKLSALHGMIGEVYISIDATTSETYADVRRGGDFGRLSSNLDFIADLRRQGLIKRLVIAFVVQAQNYREMLDFVRLGKRLGVDAVSFSRVRQWGAYTPAEFATRDIFDERHPEHHELRNLLSHPAFIDKSVWLGNVSAFRMAAQAA